MNIQDFETYRVDELNSIFINDINPESMTVPYSFDLIKDKRFKNKLRNENNVFVISTQKRNPRHHFKESKKVKLQGPFFETDAICLAQVEFMHKGYRMIGYFFQWL